MNAVPDFPMNGLESVKELTLPAHDNGDGRLMAMQAEDDIPFAIKRVFIVTAGTGVTRGRHAHKRCSQVLVCLHGACRVTCTDGGADESFRLDSAFN